MRVIRLWSNYHLDVWKFQFRRVLIMQMHKWSWMSETSLTENSLGNFCYWFPLLSLHFFSSRKHLAVEFSSFEWITWHTCAHEEHFYFSVWIFLIFFWWHPFSALSLLGTKFFVPKVKHKIQQNCENIARFVQSSYLQFFLWAVLWHYELLHTRIWYFHFSLAVDNTLYDSNTLRVPNNNGFCVTMWPIRIVVLFPSESEISPSVARLFHTWPQLKWKYYNTWNGQMSRIIILHMNGITISISGFSSYSFWPTARFFGIPYQITHIHKIFTTECVDNWAYSTNIRQIIKYENV